MSSMIIFKSAFVHSLYASIRTNLDRYLRDDTWVAEWSSENRRDFATGVELAESLDLDFPDGNNLKDIENAIRLHTALRPLTRLHARDPRLWTRLAHVDLWPYMRKRWPIEKHIVKRDKAARFVESRYFVGQSQGRALLRNGIARLWWTAELSHDPTRENPYELTAVLLSTLDITQQILERGMGRAKNVNRGFLEFLLRNKEELLTSGNQNRARIRQLAKHLNMHGGVCILDTLSEGEISSLLTDELSRLP